MSIIHEALKKTGQPITVEPQKKAAGIRPGFQPQFLRKKNRSNVGPFVALGVLLLVGAPIFAPLLKNPAQSAPGEISAGTSMPVVSANMRRQFAVEEAPLPMLPNLRRALPGHVPRFSLSGLVYSNEDSYGLINGKVVRVGDRVGDATLIEVTPNRAVLDYRGEKIILEPNEA